MAQLIARKYAIALFELAVEENCIDAINDEASFICDTLKREPHLMETLLHPQIPCDQKVEIIEKVFSGISGNMMSFLMIILKKNRESELINILNFVIGLVEEEKGVMNAEIITAAPISQSQIDKIKEKLVSKTNKTVNVSVKLDESLIGGLCIKAGGLIFDGSVKRQIEDMRLSLLR